MIFIIAVSTSFAASDLLMLSWTNNLLTVSNSKLPGGRLDIWYLEAFCRKGSTDGDWSQTVLPHQTVLLSAGPQRLQFRTTIEPEAEMRHEVRATKDELEFQFELINHGPQSLDLEWFQSACIRVGRFTGRTQSNYTARSFIFTTQGLTTLDKTRRRPDEAGRYHGGQVYVPKGIDLANVNPRPICLDAPTNGLIGCFSADGNYLLATASDKTHELFEGIYVCLHSDPHVGGLGPGASKKLRSKIYFLKNDPAELLRRYRKDFPP